MEHISKIIPSNLLLHLENLNKNKSDQDRENENDYHEMMEEIERETEHLNDED